MNNFELLLEGHYRNKMQAFGNPVKWPQIDIKFTIINSNTIESKSWYKYRGEDNPYKHARHTWKYLNDKYIEFETINLLDETPTCPYIWSWDGEWWNGHTKGSCIHKNTRVESRARFNGIEYRSLDTGYDLQTGDFLWGKKPEEGEFLFRRIDK